MASPAGLEGWGERQDVHAPRSVTDRLANWVFILRDSSQEAQNICYVAITRAKRTLFWVADPRRAVTEQR